MPSVTPEPGKWYAVRLGVVIETARVDALPEPPRAYYAQKAVCWVPALGVWRELPVSSLLYESVSPEQRAAIEQEKESKSRQRIRAMLDDINLRMQSAPVRPRPPITEPIIARQGSYFHAGDYGITRE